MFACMCACTLQPGNVTGWGTDIGNLQHFPDDLKQHTCALLMSIVPWFQHTDPIVKTLDIIILIPSQPQRSYQAKHKSSNQTELEVRFIVHIQDYFIISSEKLKRC